MSGHQPSTVKATFYVQIEPDWSSWGTDGEGEKILEGASAVRITKKRPERPKPGTVTAKLTMVLPASAFLPLRPAAVITVPADALEATPLEITVEAPEELE